MTEFNYAERHSEQSISKNADQAEFQAILNGSTALDAGFYDDEVAGALDDYENEPDEAVALDWHQRDIAKDSGVGSINEEVKRRTNLLGSSYPFGLCGNTLIYQPSGNGVYEFCLSASIQSDISSLPFAYIPRAFEKISAEIVAEFIGADSTYHVGAPRLGRMPSRFDEAMALISEKSGEWSWQPGKGFPENLAHTGDEGLDFVVAKRPGDKRMGQLFLIGQCACGDDWDQKWRELNLDRLGKWFNPVSVVKPVRVFTTPHVLSEGNILNCQSEAGLVFDRIRLASVASTCSLESPLAAWSHEIRKLSGLVLRRRETDLPKYAPPFELAARALR